MLLQLDPPLPVTTPKGKGLAYVLIDYGPEHDLLWVVFQDENGEVWTFSNKEIRAQTNITMNRPHVTIPTSIARERPRVVPND